jgi:hypothetical protein
VIILQQISFWPATLPTAKRPTQGKLLTNIHIMIDINKASSLLDRFKKAGNLS